MIKILLQHHPTSVTKTQNFFSTKEVYEFLDAQKVFETQNDNKRLREIFHKLVLLEYKYYLFNFRETSVLQFFAIRQIILSVFENDFSATKKSIEIFILNIISLVIILLSIFFLLTCESLILKAIYFLFSVFIFYFCNSINYSWYTDELLAMK